MWFDRIGLTWPLFASADVRRMVFTMGYNLIEACYYSEYIGQVLNLILTSARMGTYNDI